MAGTVKRFSRPLPIGTPLNRPVCNVNLNPPSTLTGQTVGRHPITTKRLLDRYSKKKFGAGQSDKLEGTRFARARDELSISLDNLKSVEDPDFRRIRQQRHPALMESIGISRAIYTEHIAGFCRQVAYDKVKGATYYDCTAIYLTQGRFGIERHLLSHYVTYLIPHLSPEERKTFEFYRRMTDLSTPAAAYPKARRMQRKVIMHVGPTNLGKTYRALTKLAESNRGVYCGPLRLLAYEVWRKFIGMGLPCDLVTGEERIAAADYFSNPRKFTSLESGPNPEPERKAKPRETPLLSPPEMLSVNELYDVAVIDEIQLPGDQQRGWAWTRALLGVQAHEIHLCGEETAVPIVKEICRELNEEVVVNTYERLSPLEVSSKSLRGFYGSIQEGDCLVTFSRSAIFRHKVTGLKCAVVYEAPAPENRAQQARLFNDPNSSYKVMVASDAVGMGWICNNIRRVVFDALEKFDGKGVVQVPVSQVKQIAGRAGRFNTAFKDGVALCFEDDVKNYLTYAMNKRIPPLQKVGVQPVRFPKLFSYQFPNDNMGQLLFKYSVLATVSSRYYICFGEEQLRIGALLAPLPLTLEDRMVFMMAPISTASRRSPPSPSRWPRPTLKAAWPSLTISSAAPAASHVDPAELESFEVAHKCVMLYFWLSQRLPHTMCDVARAAELKATIEKRIDFMLPRVHLSFEARKLPKRTFKPRQSWSRSGVPVAG
ncbi:RNA helicase [Massospora cicadina]|nr:RNA helicase [Massospora cicadina]